MRRACLDCVYELAMSDKRVIYIGSDLGVGVLDSMKENIPNRWFMEGVAEQHIIGMAAGLAMEGFIPYVNTIATFLTRRCFEQVVVDLCLQKLPVRLLANGGGLVYAPLGPTHQSIEDISILRAIPNMTIVAPCDADEMQRLMSNTLEWPGPIYIRSAKGGDEIVSKNTNGFKIGKGILMRESPDVTFVTTGIMTQRALLASDLLKESGIFSGVLHLHTIKPIDRQLLAHVATTTRQLITVEENTLMGGLGSAVLELLSDLKLVKNVGITRLGIPDSFVDDYGSQESMLSALGLDVASLVGTVKSLLD